MERVNKIAVLIDADNTQMSKMESVLRELSTYGRIVVKKAYGNWKKPSLRYWENEVKRLAIKTEQQFDYVYGKNATDIAMTIDAMDLLHTETYDVFALVTSDSDFTSLAIRLRESGPYIIGAGEQKTPTAFKNACDEFLLLEFIDNKENLEGLSEEDPSLSVGSEESHDDALQTKETNQRLDINDIHKLLKFAYERYQGEDGFANVAPVGAYLKRTKPDFHPKAYGFPKLYDLISKFPDKYEIKRCGEAGKVPIAVYKCV